MKRRIAWLAAIVSGLYLFVLGPIPDPIPFLDEATALMILVKSMAYLGYDVRGWIPFIGKTRAAKKSRRKRGTTIDV